MAVHVGPIAVEVPIGPPVPIVVEVENKSENAKVSIVVQDHVPSQVAENNVSVENDNVNVNMDVNENENVNVNVDKFVNIGGDVGNGGTENMENEVREANSGAGANAFNTSNYVSGARIWDDIVRDAENSGGVSIKEYKVVFVIELIVGEGEVSQSHASGVRQCREHDRGKRPIVRSGKRKQIYRLRKRKANNGECNAPIEAEDAQKVVMRITISSLMMKIMIFRWETLVTS
ncbi:hypothetical protein JCGZ_09678 [Jatropha curcas]|uniref:Uncharacterized protein n=1 Tax=Jatropha curcas TaxID=180498 RepID=A0A067LLZ5_JATCU|nr:hypothetical protein JCGZ_09678 [Jatropha curcas]